MQAIDQTVNREGVVTKEREDRRALLERLIHVNERDLEELGVCGFISLHLAKQLGSGWRSGWLGRRFDEWLAGRRFGRFVRDLGGGGLGKRGRERLCCGVGGGQTPGDQHKQ